MTYDDDDLLQKQYHDLQCYIETNEFTSNDISKIFAKALHNSSYPNTTYLYKMLQDYPDIDCNTTSMGKSIFRLAYERDEDFALFILRTKPVVIAETDLRLVVRNTRFRLTRALIYDHKIQPTSFDVLSLSLIPFDAFGKYHPGAARNIFHILPKTIHDVGDMLANIVFELILIAKNYAFDKPYMHSMELLDVIFEKFADGHDIYKMQHNGYSLLGLYLKSNYSLLYGQIDFGFINRLLQKGVDPTVRFPHTSMSHPVRKSFGFAMGGTNIIERLLEKGKSELWYRQPGALETLDRLFTAGLEPTHDDEHLVSMYNHWFSYKKRRIQVITRCLPQELPGDISEEIAMRSIGMKS